jgi:superfamily I DNA/RNA helicase/RecB family exonuclease
LANVLLDPSQQAVVDLPLGRSAVVLGAPGTGKTSTLVELIAARADAGEIAADEVLALCASRTAATALRDRLSLRLGVAAQGPRARTANSLAFGIVSAHALDTGQLAPRLLTGAEQDQIMAELLEGDIDAGAIAWPDHLPPEVRRLAGFRAELRELMARATERGLAASGLEALGREHGVAEWVAAGRFAAEYADVVAAYRDEFVTSAEVLVAAARLVAHGAVDPGVRLIAVDDAQEFTRAGLELLTAFAARGTAVIVFGDPDVATTTFRGAEPGAFVRLVDGPPLVLETAHRQPAQLRETTRRVTERIGAAGAVAQRGAAGAPEPDAAVGNRVLSLTAGSDAEQYASLARLLREQHIFERLPWGRMAVIVRSGAQVPAVARALAVAEVPTRTSIAGRALRDDWAARHLLSGAEVVLGMRALDAEVASELLLGPLGGLDAVQLRRLRLALRHEELLGGGSRGGGELVADAIAEPGRLTTIDSGPARRAERLANSLARARAQVARGATIEELLWTLWDRSKLAERWLEQSRRGGIAAEEANRNLDGVVALFAAAKRFVERDQARPATDFIAELLSAAVPEDTLAPQSLADAVQVCTPSAAVGLEFDVVAIAALHEGVWPNVRLRGSLLHPQRLSDVLAGIDTATVDERALVLADELRMFALAVSRARRTLLLCATASEDTQPSPLIGFGRPAEIGAVPYALTLRGLVGQARRLAVADAAAGRGPGDAAAVLARLADEGVAGADPAEWYGVAEPSTTAPLVDLSDPETSVRVSPSRLEAFEQSPLGWFIDTMSGGTTNTAAGIGTILHAIMQSISEQPDGDLSVEHIWGELLARWGELSFEAAWLSEHEKNVAKGLVTGLHGYLADFRDSGGTLLSAEGAFELELGRAVVSGKIDRVEKDADGAVVIVDLKTGKTPPAKDEIETHAQLSAYQLAYEAGALAESGNGFLGGARLVYVAVPQLREGRDYKPIDQPAMTEDGFARFRLRIEAAAAGMAAASFPGVRVDDEHNPLSGYRYRIHFVPEVSS